MPFRKPDGVQGVFDFNDIPTPSVVHWRKLLKKLYSSVFEWKSLPPTIDPIYLENMLMCNGMVFAYYEPTIGAPICLAAAPGDRLDVYGYPSRLNVWGMNGFTDNVPIELGAICYDNSLHDTIIGALCYYAERLSAIDDTIDVNTDNQKTPYIIRCTQQQLQSMRVAQKRRMNNYRSIIMEKNPKKEGLDVPIDVVMTPAPYVADNLQLQKQRLLTEVLNYMGVFSGVSTKAERMTTGENISQTGYIKSARDSRMKMRQKFCDDLNARLGLNVSVEFANQQMEDLSIGLINGAGYGPANEDADIAEYAQKRRETGDDGDN